jgi:glycerol-3-phosphate cytidylyltransferase-like family protein
MKSIDIGTKRKFIKEGNKIYEVVTIIYEKDEEYLKHKKETLLKQCEDANEEQRGINLEEVEYIDNFLKGENKELKLKWAADKAELISKGEKFDLNKFL